MSPVRRALAAALCLFALLLPVAWGQSEGTPSAGQGRARDQVAVTQLQARSASVSSPEEPPRPSNSLVLPVGIGRHTGDLDEMAKRQNIRALVLLSPISFFYDGGQPRGVMYEALQAFQAFTNEKLKTGALKLEVTFLPTSLAQVEAALTEGLGDIIAYGVSITPDREKRVAFSTPIETDVSQIIVTGPNFGPVSTIEGLGGKEVYVNPLTAYYQNLQKLNESLRKAGKKPIVIKAADKNLTVDDLVQMVNAGFYSSDGHDETTGRPLVESAESHQAAS